MNKVIAICLTVLTLTACANEKQIKIQTVEIKKTPLNLPNPVEIDQRDVNWKVVTRDNIDEILKEVGDHLVFAVDRENLQAIIYNDNEKIRYIVDLNTVLTAYREYYELRSPDPNE